MMEPFRNYRETAGVDIDAIPAPPTGQVIIGAKGAVIMDERTYENLRDEAELVAIRRGRTGEE